MPATGITYQSQIALNASNTTPHGSTWIPRLNQVWIANNGDNSRYTYNASGTYQSKAALPTGNTTPRGLCYVESRDEVWSLDQTKIYRIDPSAGTSPGSYALHANNRNGEGILYFPSVDEVWVVDRVDNLWYRYRASNGTYIGTYALNAANSDARGACHVAGEAWCLDGADKKIYTYGSTGTYRAALNISASHSLPRSITRVENDLWIVDNSNDSIFEYALNGLSFPVIAAIASPLNFAIHTPINFTVNITGATQVEVESDWKGLSYDWKTTGVLHLEGTPKELFEGQTFTIKATNASDGTHTTVTATYNVVPAAPIITRPTQRIKFVKGKEHNVFIPIANLPVQFNAKGLIIGVNTRVEEAGGRITGEVPKDANFTVSSGSVDLSTENAGGVDSENDVPFDILATEPALGTVTATPAGEGVAMIDFTGLTDAFGYEWTIDPITAVQPEWHFLPDTTVNSIHPADIEIVPGNLKVSLTFPQVTDALVYEYSLSSKTHNVGWTRFTGTVANSMITTIIPNLEDGVEYTLRVRVASPWIGTPVQVTVYGGRLAFCVHTDKGSTKANDYLYVFHTGVADGGVAARIKRIRLPTGCTNPRGVAILGNVAYVSNSDSVYVFNHSTVTDGNRATTTSRFLRNSSYQNHLERIAVYDDELYITNQPYANNARVHVYNRNSTNGQALTHIRNTNLSASDMSNTKAVGISASKETLFVQSDYSSFDKILAFDRNSTLSSVPKDYDFDPAAGNYNPTGLCVIDGTFYSVNDSVENLFYVFKRDPDDLDESLLIKKFTLPSGLTAPIGLDIPH